MRFVRATPLIACALAWVQAGEARAWHRHHGYLTVHATPAPMVPPGYHCPLGQWWRPSLRTCQGVPRGAARNSLPSPVAAPSIPAPSTVPGAIGSRTVSTDTRVVGRRRWRTRDGSTTTYTVVTRVVEHSPRDR